MRPQSAERTERRCIHCHRWYGPDEVSHPLRSRACVCVGCNDEWETAEEERMGRTSNDDVNELIRRLGRVG
jgi:hypothetical protein